MPLINFKTNFTNLRFGMDQPGGGDSGQPFIQNPIENANTPTDIKRFYEANRTSLDFPIRGGAISSLVNGSYTTQAAIIDADRIKKFFKSSPRGTAFIEKQKGLQLTNPLTQVPNSLQFVGFSLRNAVIPVTQVYNPNNTLAQVGVQGTGAHFNRHGVNPNLYESVRQTYQYVVGNPENNTEVTNRLAILRALKLIGNTNFLINSDTVNGIGIDPTLVDRLGISTIQNQLFNYRGGPGSNYGIGFTRIFRATNTDVTKLSQVNPDPLFTVNGQVSQPYSTIAFTYQQIAEQNTRGYGNSPVNLTIQDFRGQTNNGDPVIENNIFDYKVNLNSKYNIGDPGYSQKRRNYTDNGLGWGVDELNKLNPFYFNPASETPWESAGKYSEDLIKFAFECIDNDNPAFSVGLIFRAFFDGQISDSNTAEYNTFKYLGRGETFRTYQGFDRSISFTFKVFAQSRQEMRPLYKKLNQLISQVYPDYSPQYGLMRGNVVKLTIGDYLYRVPGFLDNVNISIDNSNTPWEVLLGEYDEPDVRQLPHMVTVQCSFKPIMDILPRKESYNSSFVPLIANKDHYLDLKATTLADQKAPANVALQDFTNTAEFPVNQPDVTVPTLAATPTAAQLLGTVDVARINSTSNSFTTNRNLDLRNTSTLIRPAF